MQCGTRHVNIDTTYPCKRMLSACNILALKGAPLAREAATAFDVCMHAALSLPPLELDRFCECLKESRGAGGSTNPCSGSNRTMNCWALNLESGVVKTVSCSVPPCVDGPCTAPCFLQQLEIQIHFNCYLSNQKAPPSTQGGKAGVARVSLHSHLNVESLIQQKSKPAGTSGGRGAAHFCLFAQERGGHRFFTDCDGGFCASRL
jgi:hypothetical protein